MPPIIDVCRLCAQPKKIKRDIFSENSNVLSKITNCLSLNITLEDSLPKKICIECQRVVEQFHSFKLKCLRAEVKLNNIVSGHTPQKSSKEIVKEEVDEIITSVHCPAHEHNYFATAPTVINVKLERNDDPIESLSQNIDDSVQVLLDEIESTPSLSDVKKPIAEVILENDWRIPCEGDTDATSKVESDNNNFESKPFVDICLDDFELAVPPSVDVSVEKNVNYSQLSEDCVLSCNKYSNNDNNLEFDDADLMLKDWEVCNIDEEAIEAEIRKKNEPSCRFECKVCNKTFKFLKGLRKHREIHNSCEEHFSCHFCLELQKGDSQFASLKSLKAHIYNKHLKTEEYSCKKCRMTFRTKWDCRLHVKSIHLIGLFKCKVCFKKFKLRSILKNHMRVHSECKSFICDLCGSEFRWESSFKYHLGTHSNEKNFLCSECGTKFASKASLLEHTHTHTGEQPYKCLICNKTFSHASTLKRHGALHKSLRHKCILCGQSFSQPNLLKQHELIHTGSRPFACKICSMTFRTQSNLCSHTKIHGEKNYKCNECDQKFTRRQQLRDHMVRHTGSKHICPAPGCGRTYSQRYPLTKHFRKQHKDLTLINKRGGRRKSNVKSELPPTKGIKYSFSYKADIPIIYCIP